MRRLAIILSIQAILVAFPAHAEEAECYVSVSSETLIDGPCQFRTDDNRMLFLSPDSERAGDPAEITVLITRPILTGNRADHGRLYKGPLPHPEAWLTRRQPDGSYKKEWIGRVGAQGSCWENDEVMVCAWKPDEPTPHQGKQSLRWRMTAPRERVLLLAI